MVVGKSTVKAGNSGLLSVANTCQNSNLKSQISDVRFEMSDLRFEI
jgi:hypothetical protein